MKVLWIVVAFCAVVGLGLLGFMAFSPLTPPSRRVSILAKGTVQQVAKEVRVRTGMWPRSSEDSMMSFQERQRLIDAHASFVYLRTEGDSAWYRVSVPGWSGEMVFLTPLAARRKMN